MLLARLFRALIRKGAITVIDPQGMWHICDSGVPGPRATIRIHDNATARRLILNPTLEAGEAYMDGTLTIESGTLYDFLDACTANLHHLFDLPLYSAFDRASRVLRGLAQINPVGRSKRNVAQHYDLSGKLYDLFLDTDRQYS
jgi:cyclopropane-fatty-acyl-phospholipid synthase